MYKRQPPEASLASLLAPKVPKEVALRLVSLELTSHAKLSTQGALLSRKDLAAGSYIVPNLLGSEVVLVWRGGRALANKSQKGAEAAFGASLHGLTKFLTRFKYGDLRRP